MVTIHSVVIHIQAMYNVHSALTCSCLTPAATSAVQYPTQFQLPVNKCITKNGHDALRKGDKFDKLIHCSHIL